MTTDVKATDPETLKRIGEFLTALVVEKNAAYGDASAVTEKIMALLYPNGIAIEQYSDALLMVRTLDKLCRIALGNKAAFGESPWKDVGGYGILGAAKDDIRSNS